MVTGYVQKAQGQFVVNLRPNTPHCGPIQSDFPASCNLKYYVMIRWSPDALDPSGFLMDNLWFASYFQSFQGSQISISCERFAQLMAEDICREIGDRLRKCSVVYVRLEPIRGVTVECRVKPEITVGGRHIFDEQAHKTAQIGVTRQNILAGAGA